MDPKESTLGNLSAMNREDEIREKHLRRLREI
jgi:hypothetical protein